MKSRQDQSKPTKAIAKLEEKAAIICKMRESLAYAWLHSSREYFKNPSAESEKAMHQATHNLQSYLEEFC